MLAAGAEAVIDAEQMSKNVRWTFNFPTEV
jgi:hypothetical protein